MAVAEKRPLSDNVFSTKHIITDIEGTTTSISFVKDTLFPYVRQNLDGYLKSQWSDEEFKDVLGLLRDQADEDKKAELEGVVEIPKEGSEDDIRAAVAKNVLWQMDADRKTTALKKLQGQMWRQGYKNGELKGHLFSDVAPALREWAKDGRKLYVYSSGSVEAQKLLFGNSTEGDLTELFTDYFDTAVGAKVEVESYKNIVKKLDCNADDVLFLTDLPKEASAAREAGLPVLLVEREGNEPLSSDLHKEYPSVSSFDQVSFETVSKKHKAEEDTENETSSKKLKVDEDSKEENTTKAPEDEELEEETKPAEKDSASMDVDVESAVGKDVEVTESEVKTDAMDVDKPSEEPKIEESTKAQTVDDKTVQSHENSGVEKSEENAAKTEVAVMNEENGSVEETKSKQDIDDSKAVEVDKKSNAEESQGVSANGDLSESSTNEVNPAVEEKEKPLEEVPVIEKAEVKEKTEVPQEKTEERDVEKMETDCENKLPKEDSKTDVVVEASAVLSELKKDNAEKPEDVKVEEANDKKDSVMEVTGQDKEENDQKMESTEVKTSSAIEVSAENQNKSEKAAEEEGHVSKELNGEANGNGNVEANGDANGETKQVAEKENGEKEKINGSANGKDAETNGKVSNGNSNGHSEEKDLPEVIVTKNAAQIENGSGDAAVVVEA
ncbi:enolase-phosphatase E1 [Thrips palmi]|uniref:Enolase-phosphatase E1 n=1 Tax=Thrips palmi TaxID=161013 RepID=A0A6P8YNS6_THRPL|nr:enolase-phosphatase E1 [Thrips palmi]